jgi:hypothetical protein
MAIVARPPLTDEAGDVRELTEEDALWAASGEDFGGFDGVIAFLNRRTEILRAAEAFGMPEETFLGLDPSKPGFEARAAAALRAVLKVAEEKAAEAAADPGMAAE